MLFQNNFLGYFLYFDDILIVYNDSTTDIDKVLNSFKNAKTTMKFSIEEGMNNTINFFSVTAQKGEENFSLNINPKPTVTDTIIPSDSCHPHEHKYGAIQYMVNRINTYLLNKSNRKLE